MKRRILLLSLSAAALGLPFMRPGLARDGSFPFTLTDEEWQARLTPEAYQVLRHEATERAFTSPLNNEKRAGTFHCAGCNAALFEAAKKFESGTGWPSFWDFIPGSIGMSVDTSYFMTRTEVHCANCGGHQGYVFDDGPQPTGLRYCINGVALRFASA